MIERFTAPGGCDGSKITYPMSYTANRIHSNIFQGGFPPPGEGLANAGIDILVLCAMEWQDASAYPGLEVILAGGDDDRRLSRLMQFLPLWQTAAKQVVTHVKAGKKVLITCMQGLNRSGVVTALARRELTGMSGQEIVSHIQARREGALFNDTFAQYIIDTYPTPAV